MASYRLGSTRRPRANFEIRAHSSLVEYLLDTQKVRGSIPRGRTMIKASEYILLSREERRKHIDLSEPCLEMFEGSANLHHAIRGILAYFLGTSVPVGRRILACHACNNRVCGSPKHIYWGTPEDNIQDQIECGTYSSIKDRMIKKNGLHAWMKHAAKASSIGGEKSKGKPNLKNKAHSLKNGNRPPSRLGIPRTWSTGSRKGIKMPRFWSRRKSEQASPNGEGPGR